MKNRVLKLLYAIAYHAGVVSLFYFINRKRQRILAYHNVINDDLFDDGMVHLGVSCSTSSFSKQLDIVLSRFTVTTDLGQPGSCIISFDDGYKNNIEIAARLLTARGVCGLFFVPACYFEGSNIVWSDRLLMWVAYVPAGHYSILGSKFVIGDTASRHRLWSHLYDSILADYSMRDFLLENLDRICPFDNIRKLIPDRMFELRFVGMDSSDIIELKSMGHRIGCHSFQHDVLSLLSSEQLDSDFLRCALYSNIFDSNLYSYPFGGKSEVSPSVISMCKKYGYSAAFTNCEGDSDDVFAIGRASLGNVTDKYCIEARLSGFEGFLKGVSRFSSKLNATLH